MGTWPTVIKLYELWQAQKRNTNLFIQALGAPITKKQEVRFSFGWIIPEI
ncbi:MAG: hypothetical protein IGS39_08700 [Calothrix sp. C42_A2020_038]|nr:hypothetical protein [Calothrix sp. C42_A2020_038]